MQYHHHRSRLPPPPPPPPYGRGGGGAVYPRGHKQLYAPPRRPQLPAPPPPPQRRYEVLMEAGRLAAEYLVSTGVLPPSSLQRGGGDAWAVPPPPPPLPQQQQEPPAFYGRRRYDDAYSNNPSTRPRRSTSTSSSSDRDSYDCSNGGSYSGRGKRKYGEYRRGHLDWGREREQEKGRPSSNGRRYEEDNDEDGAPGFRKDRSGSGWNDEARSCVTEEVREATPSMAKAVMQLEMEDVLSNAVSSNGVSSSGDVGKNSSAQPEVPSENEDGVMEEDKVSSLESEVAEQGMGTDGDVNTASTIVVMEAEAKLLLDDKLVDEEAEDNGKVLCQTSLDHIALDDDMTNLENGLHVDSLLKQCAFAKAPTKPRSVRANRKATIETVDLVSSGEASQMVVDEQANERSLTDIPSDNREDQIYQDNTSSSRSCNEIIQHMLLQENKTSVGTENMSEDRKDAQLLVVEEFEEEETDVSPLITLQKDSLMQENNLSPLTASHGDGLMQESNLSTLTETHNDSVIEETDLSLLTDPHNDSLIEQADLSSLADPHNDSLIEESELSPLITYHEVRLMQETDLPQAMSSHEDNLNLQFKEEAQICDIDMPPEDVNLIDLSDQKNTVDVKLFPNARTKTIANAEEENLEQSSSFVMHNDPGFGHSVPGSSVEPHKTLQEDFGARAGDNVSGTTDICQVPLDNNSVQLFDIEDDTQIEVAGFNNSSKAENEMICSSMDDMMHPGIHTDDLPVIQDYNLALSDYLVADIPCYTSMQPDLQAGICTNGSEGIPMMDDPIYGSLTDIPGFMDVWGQPAEDFEKFF